MRITTTAALKSKHHRSSSILIQLLRAFRQAKVIVDAVLFESCVGGVAVAMTVASIFHFEFWFLWGVVLGAFWVDFGSFVDPKGVPWIPLGVI